MSEDTPITPTVSVKLLDKKNSEWMLHHDQWEALDLLYEGGVRLKNNGQNFLIKRPKELFDVYQERYRRLTYQDILGNCVGWYLAKLFAVEPQIDGKTTDKRWDGFLQDCDRSGTTFANFTKQWVETMMIFRRAFILIDKPQPQDDDPVLTRADEQRQGLDQPYCVLYDPRQVFNWSLDQYGNLEWIVIKTMSFRQPDPLKQVEQTAHWWIFDKRMFHHWQYTNPKPSDSTAEAFFNNSITDDSDKVLATLVAEGEHSLASQNRVPVRVCELPISLWFANRAYLHLLEHLDTLNGYAWKLFMSNHPQLVIQTDEELTGITQSETSYIKLGKDAKIFFLEPDGRSFAESRNYLELMRQEIYRGFHLQAQGKSSSASADGASGYSKEMDMAPAVDILNACGDLIRSQQQLVLLDYKAAAAMPVNTPEAIPDVNGYRFETKPVLGDIDLSQAMIDTGIFDKSPTLERVMDMRIGLTAADGENEETKAAIVNEIKTAPTRKEQADQQEQAQQQAFATKFQKATAVDTIQNLEGSVQ